jgi:phosphoglycerate dehydrogenase-like enzyme
MQEKTATYDNENGVTLVLGGTGKTGRRVAERLQSRGVATRIAS